ncbi:MAG: hypothetical protein ACRYHQ_04660 [Janthinobacterium lividum]
MVGPSAPALCVPMVVCRGRTVQAAGLTLQPGETVNLSPEDAAFLQGGGFVTTPDNAAADVKRVDFIMPKRGRTDAARV